ncbi:hypothetical protein IE81DRAFT_152478 [Ceraceosorus guamensis]|uniref:CsbD-like domain-containing protein n=1 Tax=Ceraceosorus guamensis TaxID=1522189 RepID=A0A316VZM8_9BASI|nr:hypothetical protein IE81DRAFT_152478 [Ceraceosorus guamensis]PWN41893.1 hypothetical protein IE81DRAFT_152478 [Ceraceosorus guamensis]
MSAFRLSSLARAGLTSQRAQIRFYSSGNKAGNEAEAVVGRVQGSIGKAVGSAAQEMKGRGKELKASSKQAAADLTDQGSGAADSAGQRAASVVEGIKKGVTKTGEAVDGSGRKHE